MNAFVIDWEALKNEVAEENIKARAQAKKANQNKPLRIQIPPNYSWQNVANFYLEKDIECMAQYRNESGKLTLPDKFKDIPDKDVFFYLGHGGTLLDTFGRPSIQTVPENCIYITQTVCGVVNTLDPTVIRSFMDPENARIWKDPLTHVRELRRLFRGATGIHIHMPGCTYTDSTFLPISTNGKPTDISHLIQYSGMLTLETAKTIPEDSKYIGGTMSDLPDGLVDANIIKEIYKYSVFPVIEEQKGSNHMPNDEDLESIHLYKNAENKVKIADIINQANTLTDNYPVSRILEMKPGIHFNFLCRSVSVGANKRRNITLRRKHSALVQNTIGNTISKLAGMGLRGKNDFGNDKAVLSFIKSVRDNIEEKNDLESIFDAYIDLRFHGLHESKKYLRKIFETLYKEEFVSLIEKLAEEEDEDKIQSLKAQIGRLVKLLDMRIPYLDQPTYFDMEIELMVFMAFTALVLNDYELYYFLCKRGVDVNRLYSKLEEQVKNGSMEKELLESMMPSLEECNDERKHFVYSNTNTNDNTNTSSVKSYRSNNSNNRRGGKRKTKKRKSSAA